MSRRPDQEDPARESAGEESAATERRRREERRVPPPKPLTEWPKEADDDDGVPGVGMPPA